MPAALATSRSSAAAVKTLPSLVFLSDMIPTPLPLSEALTRAAAINAAASAEGEDGSEPAFDPKEVEGLKVATTGPFFLPASSVAPKSRRAKPCVLVSSRPVSLPLRALARSTQTYLLFWCW